jgi:hypothetical protein
MVIFTVTAAAYVPLLPLDNFLHPYIRLHVGFS